MSALTMRREWQFLAETFRSGPAVNSAYCCEAAITETRLNVASNGILKVNDPTRRQLPSPLAQVTASAQKRFLFDSELRKFHAS